MYKEKGIMEEKLKTLKDFIPKGTRAKNDLFDELKAEVIKWVKEDIEEISYISAGTIIGKWKKRLNITSEDLK